MTERDWRTERFLHRCWEALEGRFYDYWVHGMLWCFAGAVGLAATLLSAREWAFVSARLVLAGLVLGVGIGFLRALGWWRMVHTAPYTFVSIFAGYPCPTLVSPRHTFFLRLMEGGFVLLECLVLFGLLGLSTLATVPMGKKEQLSLAVVLWVYGFFALTFGGKSMMSALAWGYWLRPYLERTLNWQGANWLLASGRWTLMRFNLMRPISRPSLSARPMVWAWRGLMVCLLLMLAIFALTLAALTMSR